MNAARTLLAVVLAATLGVTACGGDDRAEIERLTERVAELEADATSTTSTTTTLPATTTSTTSTTTTALPVTTTTTALVNWGASYEASRDLQVAIDDVLTATDARDTPAIVAAMLRAADALDRQARALTPGCPTAAAAAREAAVSTNEQAAAVTAGDLDRLRAAQDRGGPALDQMFDAIEQCGEPETAATSTTSTTTTSALVNWGAATAAANDFSAAIGAAITAIDAGDTPAVVAALRRAAEAVDRQGSELEPGCPTAYAAALATAASLNDQAAALAAGETSRALAAHIVADAALEQMFDAISHCYDYQRARQ